MGEVFVSVCQGYERVVRPHLGLVHYPERPHTGALDTATNALATREGYFYACGQAAVECYAAPGLPESR